jgi:hypothetical protein
MEPLEAKTPATRALQVEVSQPQNYPKNLFFQVAFLTLTDGFLSVSDGFLTRFRARDALSHNSDLQLVFCLDIIGNLLIGSKSRLSHHN